MKLYTTGFSISLAERGENDCETLADKFIRTHSGMGETPPSALVSPPPVAADLVLPPAADESSGEEAKDEGEEERVLIMSREEILRSGRMQAASHSSAWHTYSSSIWSSESRICSQEGRASASGSQQRE